jgi:diguanylate cyclase (GGDEF)-like protein
MSTAEQLKPQYTVEDAFKPYEHFAKVMLDAYVLIDADGRIVKLNPLFCQLVDKRAKQVLKADSLDSMLRFYIKDKQLPVQELLNYRDATRIDEVRGENDVTNDLNLIIGVYPFFNEEQVHIGAFILIRDVTAEKNLHDAYKTTKTHSITDTLTGLYTRRYFEDFLQLKQRTYINRESRDAESLCILMIDIDHFKKVNDVHGHQAGDAVLKAMGSILSKNLRKTDTPCRYGGEEFLVILATAMEGAKAAAEKLRREVEKTEIFFENRLIPITISCGLAEIDFGKEKYQDSIKRADEALYASKKAGRNRISFYTSIMGGHIESLRNPSTPSNS